MTLAFVNAARAPVKARWVREVIAAQAAQPEVAARLPLAPWSANVRLAGDRELRRLNARFAGEDHVTDVLSFASGDAAPAFLGDIVISWQAAQRQAQAFGHPAQVEVALLAAHGFLHLLGWDHATPREEAEMNRITLAGLSAGGLALGDGRLLDGGVPG
ncbi:MAG: rRNA maturation RNase YbeY [Candidatus Dormibacteraeota bacterium]|nr:rRNA maturation RNase YbeY [Candidatus Dormibacteraeota bacterium]